MLLDIIASQRMTALTGDQGMTVMQIIGHECYSLMRVVHVRLVTAVTYEDI